MHKRTVNYGVALLVLLAFVGTTAFRVSIPAIAFYAREVLSASAFSVGLLTSMFFAARAVASVLAGFLSGRAGKFLLSLIITTSFIINGFIVLLYGLVESIVWLLAVRLCQGFLNGIAWVLVQYVLGISVSENIRGRIYAVYFALGSLGSVLGNFIYSLISRQELTLSLIVSSTMYVLSGIIALVAVRTLSIKSEIKRTHSNLSFKDVERASTYGFMASAILLLLIVLGISAFSSIVRGDLIYIYLSESFSLSKSYVAELVGITGLGSLIGAYLISWLSDKCGNVLALRVSSLLGALGSILLNVRLGGAAITGLLLFYIASSSVMPVSRRAAITEFKLSGLILGVVNAVGNLGSVAGSAIAGYLYDLLGVHSTEPPLYAMATLPLMAFAASILLKERREPTY
ncbi:MAG: hypothetical protein B6U85_10035 [Desulfurococcales archaeon ex4484_42]|nr:MAG: hypothetical protein B6U85_10035 [Desulfurococcales archaeon ex4484_42]